MFFDNRRRFNGDVAALLPGLGIDMKEAGITRVLHVLDGAWERNYSTYEAALTVAYSFALGLVQVDADRAQALVKERVLPVQSDWISKGIVRAELVEQVPSKIEALAARTAR